MGALGARRVPRERVRGLSALRLVERSGTEITVVKRRPRQRALRNVPRQPEQYPYDAPTWEVSDSEGHVHIVELTSQDDRQQSFFRRVKGEENTYREAPAQDQSSSSPTETALL